MDPILTLIGPTGVGKTALSIQIAKRLDAEIISADSRQVYIELNIGTAKPSEDELEKVPHHFINELHLGVSFSAGEFERLAKKRIEDILARGRVPIIVGGSTLYIEALQKGLADIPSVLPDVREKIKGRLTTEGADRLYEELTLIDPNSARSMDPTKTQRLIRALEVYYGTGKPLSYYYQKKKPYEYAFRTVILDRERSTLYRRINDRVDQMINAGLVREVKNLLARGFDPELATLRTIGYQEPIAYLRGEYDQKDMVRLIKRNTRRYAKRQLTWFRRYPEKNWYSLDENGQILEKLL